jgi:hypothetical protein
VVSRLPAAKSGDLSPERTSSLQRAAKKAVAEWIENNI